MTSNNLLEAALSKLGHEIWIATNNTWQDAIDPTSNEGSEIVTDTFEMRSFCWCDGSRHETCPPNFKWKDFEVEWYKYLGRGMEQNRDITPQEIAEMLDSCIDSLRRLPTKSQSTKQETK